MYQAGATLKLDFGAYSHYGIADGNGGVIHSSKKHGKVVNVPYQEFSQGTDILVSSIKGEIISRAAITAQQYVGLPYNIFLSNSEHFARICHGLERESTQIQKAALSMKNSTVVFKKRRYFLKRTDLTMLFTKAFTSRVKVSIKNATAL